MKDGRGSGEIYGKPRGLIPWFHAATRGKPSRNPVCREMSRVAIKIILMYLTEMIRLGLQLRLYFISQPGKGWTRARVLDNAPPLRVAVEFRQNCRQVLHQLSPLFLRQSPYRRLDFFSRAHGEKSAIPPSDSQFNALERESKKPERVWPFRLFI
jgi:hypothetical protein